MRSGTKIIAAMLALAPVTACGMIDGRSDNARPQLGLVNAQKPQASSAPILAPVALAPTDVRPKPVPVERWPAGPMMLAALAGDDHPIVGDPYTIGGVIWTPADVPSLDEVGYAAMLDEAGAGRRTFNGEAYAPDAISAAHRTLPVPSYVEVTALDTGKTILVRINDRGPMLNDRVIGLSPGAARQLGVDASGTAPVRVRKVSPLEQERAMLRAGAAVAERIETPPGLRTALARGLPAAPAPISGPAATLGDATVEASSLPSEPIFKLVPVQNARAPARPPASVAATVSPARPSAPAAAARQPRRTGGYVVQIAALSSRARADALARSVNGFVMPVGSLFRVRTGPYPSEGSARGALGGIHAKGYAEARVVVNDAR